MIPVLSKLLLNRFPREDIDALRGVPGVREPSPRIARFCSIFGVSRGASGRRENPLESSSRDRCAARRRASASTSIRRTSSSTALSSSGGLCFPLVLGAIADAARNFLLGGWDGPAMALPLSTDGCWEGVCWGLEPRIMTRPPRCSSPLRTGHNVMERYISIRGITEEYMAKRVRFRFWEATSYFMMFRKNQAHQSRATHIFTCAFSLRCAVGVRCIIVRGLALAGGLGRAHEFVGIACYG